MRARVSLFVMLVAFWLVLSDQYSVLFLTMGVFSAAAVAWFMGAFFDSVLGPPTTLGGWSRRAWPTASYLVWLLWRALVSTAEVAWIVLHPRLPVEPGFVRFRTQLRSPLARATLANSITLVPGTLTVRVVGDEFLVHALWPAAADDLRTGRMQRRIAVMFGEPCDDEEVVVDWEPAGDLR